MTVRRSFCAAFGVISTIVVVLLSNAAIAEASPAYSTTFIANAPTASLGTIRQVRVDRSTGTLYVQGSSTSGFGKFSSDGTSYSTISYDTALGTNSGSDLAILDGVAYISTQGVTNKLYRYEVSGSTASKVAEKSLVSGSTAVTVGATSDAVYASKSTTLYSVDSLLVETASPYTTSYAITRQAYGGEQLFYLSSTGRLMRTTFDGLDVTLGTGAPSSGTAKGLAAAANGGALYYASTSSLGKLLTTSTSTVWTSSLSSAAGMDIDPTTGKIYIINTTGFITVYDPIAAPTSVSASPSGSSVTLNWTTGVLDSDFRGVTIRRSTSSYPTSPTDGSAVTSTSMATSFTDTGLDDGTYYYSFFNETADGYFSTAATSSAIIAVPPAAPILNAITSSNTVTLTWSVPADTQRFVLRRSTDHYPTSYTDATAVTSTTSDITTLVQSGLSDGTYYYSLFAADSGDNYSDAGTVNAVIDTVGPSQPTLSAVVSGSTASLSWDVPADTEIFFLRRSTVDYPSTILEGSAVTTTADTNFAITSLEDGLYYFSLFARDSFGNYSTPGMASVTVDTTDPGPPTDVSASVSSHSVLLRWTNPIASDLTTVTVRRSTTGYPSSVTDGDDVFGGFATNYTDSALGAATYYYSIFASDAAGNTSTRATVSATVTTSASTSSSSGGGVGAAVSMAPSAAYSAPLAFSISNAPMSTDTIPTVFSPTVQLNLNADPATVRGYAVSLDPQFTHASIIPLTPAATTYELPNVAGIYTLYLKYYSLSGHASSVFTQSVRYAPATLASSRGIPAVEPSIPLFTRTLRQGDRGTDVRALQIFLNRHGYLVAKSGPGSIGNESTFFGPATAKAVKAFQEAYKEIILLPYELQRGTGIFGTNMRELVNRMR